MDPANVPVVGPASAGTPCAIQLPEVTIALADPDETTLTRRGTLHKKQKLAVQRGLLFDETRGLKVSPEKTQLYKSIAYCSDEEALLEQHLQNRFVPLHGPTQLLSPRAFFVSPLFRVRKTSAARAVHIEFDFPEVVGRPRIRYAGPELRQTDGRVFLSLLHMMRDIEVGTAASFQPEAVCKALFGRYDGPARKLLLVHIRRLQHAVIVFERFSVQLCGRFEFPKLGPWTVGLDPQIVELFRASPEVWLRMQPRLMLPDGLATWVFAYIESQTKLIPQKLETLRLLCGSEASPKAFLNRMRDALRHLTHAGILDGGWSVKGGLVRWMKTPSKP